MLDIYEIVPAVLLESRKKAILIGPQQSVKLSRLLSLCSVREWMRESDWLLWAARTVLPLDISDK